MTTSTLILPVAGEQNLASWAAVAFVASYSSRVNIRATRGVRALGWGGCGGQAGVVRRGW